jgi:hypothetical protein
LHSGHPFLLTLSVKDITSIINEWYGYEEQESSQFVDEMKAGGNFFFDRKLARRNGENDLSANATIADLIGTSFDGRWHQRVVSEQDFVRAFDYNIRYAFI